MLNWVESCLGTNADGCCKTDGGDIDGGELGGSLTAFIVFGFEFCFYFNRVWRERMYVAV